MTKEEEEYQKNQDILIKARTEQLRAAQERYENLIAALRKLVENSGLEKQNVS